MTLGSGFSNLIRISVFLSLRKKSSPYCVDLSSTRTVTVVYSRLLVSDLRCLAESFILAKISANGATPCLWWRGAGDAEAGANAKKVTVRRNPGRGRKSQALMRQVPRSGLSVAFGNGIELVNPGRSQVRFLVYQGMALAGFSRALIYANLT